jgi:hypothetical protein
LPFLPFIPARPVEKTNVLSSNLVAQNSIKFMTLCINQMKSLILFWYSGIAKLLQTMPNPILNILSSSRVILLFPLLFFFAVTQSYSMVVTLQWDANTEPDLAGYMVYYKQVSSGPPYNGTGATEGNSPIDVDNTTTCTVTALIDGVTYFFVVTAYDTEDLESDYSNEVATSPEPTAPESATGAGGDAGGGCFIATAAFGSNIGRHVQIPRKFRDNHLLTNRVGRGMVDLYCQLSPPGAVSDGLKVYWSHDLR